MTTRRGLGWGRRRTRTLFIGLAVLAVTLPTSSVALAAFTRQATSTASLTTDTLDPPTSLAATGGSSVGLTWTITPDSYATGYGLYRGATSGGTPSLISTVTPRFATSTADSPGAGTWYYVLRSQYQSWTSAASNQASASVSIGPTTTAEAPCTTTAADTTGAGDNNGYESNAGDACVDDSTDAVDDGSGTGGSALCGTGATPDPAKDRHRFWGFAAGLPASVTSIDGIQVRADVGLDNSGGTSSICAQLSWDGGNTWTTIKAQTIASRSETTYTFGSASDTWGRAWTVGQFATSSFRVRLIDASTMGSKGFQLDYVAVSVTYRP